MAKSTYIESGVINRLEKGDLVVSDHSGGIVMVTNDKGKGSSFEGVVVNSNRCNYMVGDYKAEWTFDSFRKVRKSDKVILEQE
jgi:hypothetical protein